jgi:predicted MFS family arabinose efflux permease
MLCFGAVIGLVCDAWDRKRILLWGLALNGAVALTISLLAVLGWARPWQVGLAAFVSGTVWATELPGRRRMIGEFAGTGAVSRAIALDSLTNSLARIAGPLLGGLAYAWVGLAGAYALSAACYLAGAFMVPGISHAQQTRKLALLGLLGELAQGVRYASRAPVVLSVLAVTATMNLFAFSYTAIVPPLARVGFGVGDALVGLLAAGEPTGALLGGLVLARWTPRWNPVLLLVAGSAIFMSALVAMALAPSYPLACLTLLLGGVGLALFGNMQTSLILTEVPAAIRSRQMGLITVSIGIAPLGHLLIGLLADAFGPSRAVLAAALLGLLALAGIARLSPAASPLNP